MACLFIAYLFHLVSAITSDSPVHLICFLFSHHSSADKEQRRRFPESKHTNRFVLLIESICFWIAANERAIRSDNTSEETAVRRWVTTTSAIKDQQSLKEGITSFLCRPAVSLAPYGVAVVCGPGIIAVFTCWTEELAWSWLFTPA